MTNTQGTPLEPMWHEGRIGVAAYNLSEVIRKQLFGGGEAEIRKLLREIVVEYERERAATAERTTRLSSEHNEIEQTLGAALNYPRYVDDPANFSTATEADGVCVGEHTAATLAQEAAQTIARLEARVGELEAKVGRARKWLPEGVLEGDDEEC